jgi:hypothetical protein
MVNPRHILASISVDGCWHLCLLNYYLEMRHKRHRPDGHRLESNTVRRLKNEANAFGQPVDTAGLECDFVFHCLIEHDPSYSSRRRRDNDHGDDDENGRDGQRRENEDDAICYHLAARRQTGSKLNRTAPSDAE